MLALTLDRALVIEYEFVGEPDSLRNYLQSFYYSWSEDSSPFGRLKMIPSEVWYSWLAESDSVMELRKKFPPGKAVVIAHSIDMLQVIQDNPVVMEFLVDLGMPQDKVVTCMSRFLFSSLSDRLLRKSAAALDIMHSTLTFGLHVRLGDMSLLKEYQKTGLQYKSSVNDSRPFSAAKTTACLDKLFDSVDKYTHLNSSLFFASDSKELYSLFSSRYPDKVFYVDGLLLHTSRKVDDKHLNILQGREKAFMDWYLLSQVDLLVHAFSSSFSKTAGMHSFKSQTSLAGCKLDLSGMRQKQK